MPRSAVDVALKAPRPRACPLFDRKRSNQSYGSQLDPEGRYLLDHRSLPPTEPVPAAESGVLTITDRYVLFARRRSSNSGTLNGSRQPSPQAKASLLSSIAPHELWLWDRRMALGLSTSRR
jgi:hypothetical protein